MWKQEEANCSPGHMTALHQKPRSRLAASMRGMWRAAASSGGVLHAPPDFLLDLFFF